MKTRGVLYDLEHCFEKKIRKKWIWHIAQHKWLELDTQQHCRDNVKMFSGHKIVGYHIMSMSLWLLHLDSETLTIVLFFRVTKALLHCRVVVVAKLNNCRAPSFAIHVQLHKVAYVSYSIDRICPPPLVARQSGEYCLRPAWAYLSHPSSCPRNWGLKTKIPPHRPICQGGGQTGLPDGWLDSPLNWWSHPY